MDRYVQCLSPVHIGTGNTLEPSEYIFENERYIRPDMDAVFARMTDEQIEGLAVWASDRADRIAVTANNRQQSELRQEMNLLRFADRDAELRRALLEDDQLTQYRGKAGFDRIQAIRELVKGGGCDPLIPGSSIKGAMRTALAYLALKEMGGEERRQVLDGDRESDIRGLRALTRQRGGLRKDQIGQEVEKLIFRCGEMKDGRISYQNIHGDLLRAVSVSDTFAPQAELIVPQVYTFAARRNRDKQVVFQAQAPIVAEAHAPGNRFRIRLQVDAALLQGIARQQRQGHWIKFRERVARTFGPEVGQLVDGGNEEEIRKAVVARIEKACRAFSKAIAAKESAWVDQHQEASRLKDFYQKLDDLNAKLVPLRLGWGSHFPATTLMMALLQESRWRSVLEDFVRMFKMDIPMGVQARRNRKIDLDAFPKSRRLTAINKQPTAPFGWIVMGCDEQSLPGGLVAVDKIMRAPRPVERGARSRHGQGGGQFRGRPQEPREPQYGSTREKADPVLAAKLKKARQQKPGQTQGPRRGERVAAEVLSNNNQRVTVRLKSGEEITIRKPYFPPKAGASIKVKVDAVNNEGKVTRVVI